MYRTAFLIASIFISNVIFSQQQIIVDPSGQGDHTSIQSAFDAINGTTLTSDVSILIRAGQYDEQLTLSNIDNTASAYTITVGSESGNAVDVVLKNSAIVTFQERILNIEGTDNVHINNLTFKTSTSNTEVFIKLANGIDKITFENNVFLNETSNSAYAIFDNYDFFSDDDTTSNLTILNNRFSDVYAFASYFQAWKNIRFENNTMEDLVTDNSGDLNNWSQINGLTISGNTIDGYSLGSFTDCQDVVINGNRISAEEGGMVLSSNYDEGHSTYKVFNNFFIVRNYGINVLLAGLEVDIANNNFYATGNSSDAALLLNTYVISEIENRVTVYNNNFYAEGSGAYGVMMFNDPDSLEMTTLEFDYNNYFSAEEDHHWQIFNNNYFDLNLSQVQADYGFESNGLSIDPLYQSETDLHIGNVGLKDQGLELDYVTVDIDGELREDAPDIGADELRGFVNLVPDDTLRILGQYMGGKNIQVRYRVENQGNLTLGGEWTDAIYLSDNSTLDASDRKLTTLEQNFLLPAGESYLGDVSIELPIDITGGSYYLLLHVNDEGKEFDNTLSDNITVSDPITFLDPLYPDLEVTVVITPPTQFSGKSFELEWTVTNKGTAPTGDTWQDYIFVANQAESLEDPSIMGSDSLFLRRVASPVSLNPGESYQQSVTVSIPLRYSGKIYYRVQANGSESLTELDSTFTDNGRISDVVNITQSPLPDLSVINLGTPATAFSGEKVPVNWTIENVGQQTTYRTSIQLNDRDWLDRANYNYWYDYVYISKKPWYDEEEPTQRVAARYYRGTEELDAGASYTVNDSIEFFSCEYGLYYVFVRTNDDRYTYELTYQNNINLLDSIELIIDPKPDLVPTAISFTGTPSSGRPLEVTYSVENSGFSDKPQSRVMDYFYISTLDSLVEEESIFIGYESFTDPLAMEESYSRTVTLDLPYEEFGDYYLYLKTDGEDNICEVQGENNNVIRLPIEIQLSEQPDLVPAFSGVPDTLVAGNSYNLTFAVTNEGEADAVQNAWYDEIHLGVKPLFKKQYSQALAAEEVYLKNAAVNIDLNQEEGEYLLSLTTDSKDNLFEYGGELNNTISKEIFISRDPAKVPDLSLESISISNESLVAGDVLMLDYSVRNQSATTPRSSWTDQLYLLDLDGNIVFSKQLKHVGAIASGELFTGTHEVKLPYTLQGNYTIELTLNIRRTLVEYETDNNSATIATDIAAYIPPDLEVKDVQYASCCQLYALQDDNLVVEIGNNGPGDLSARSFTLRVLLAEDQAGSNGNTLVAHREEYSIPAGGSISVTIPVTFDAYLSGDYFTIVELDTENEVYEGKATGNNRYVTGYSVNIDNEPLALRPVDLTITSSVSPDFSRWLFIEYTVEKGSGKALQRYMEDQVILSANRKFDKDDYRFSRFEPEYRNIPAETTSYEGSLNAYIPTYLAPGWYYVGVKVDAQNNVLEPDETNNELFTADSFYLDFTIPLELDQPLTRSFYEGTVSGQRAFSLSRPAGKGMIATVDFSDNQASSELYHRVGAMPTRAVFDNRYRDPFLADQEVIVPVTDTNTFDYLRLVANRVPWVNDSPLDFECWTNFVASSGGNVIGILNPECLLPDTVPYTITAQSAEYSILRSIPDSASYLGVSNVLIEGFDFEEDMQFYLVEGTDSIPAQRVEILSSTEAMAVFDLRDEAAGTYDMVARKVTGESTVKEDYFTIFMGRPPVPWASVNHALRNQLTSKKLYVNVDFGNYSHMNGYDYWFIVAFVPKSQSLENFSSTYIGSSIEEYYDQLEVNPNPTADSNFVDIDGIRFYAYWVPILPPRSQTTFSYIIESSAEDYVMTQAFFIEQPLSPFKLSTDIGNIGQSVTVAQLLDGVFNLPDAIELPIETGGTKKSVVVNSLRSSFNCGDLNIKEVELAIAKDVVSHAQNIHGGAKAYKGASNLTEAAEMAIKNKKEAFTEAVEGAVDFKGKAKGAAKDIVKDKLRSALTREKSAYETAQDYAVKFYDALNPWTDIKEHLEPDKMPFEDLINNTFSCIDAGSVEKRFEECYHQVRDDTYGGYRYAPVISDNCFPPKDDGGGGNFITRFVNSFDPNEIEGPEGVTDARMVDRSEVMRYTIRFENKAEASAPARFVSINNDLPEELRSQSLVLTEFGFGDTTILVEPTNRLEYRMELGKKYNYQELSLVAGIDIVNNRAFWRFSTIDPETGNLTTDPFNGFLPPNDSTGIGEGFVTYEILIDPITAGGTFVENQAEIIFDQNEVIPTNIWSNLVSSSDPVSQVNALPEISDSTFTLTWEGSAGDLSAGIREFDIYVSMDDEPYEVLLENTLSTSISFSGTPGSTYRFYSILTTLDGIREKTPLTADAVTEIRTVTDTSGNDTSTVGFDILPQRVMGEGFTAEVYPNPALDRVWIEYESGSEIQLTMFDLRGRKILERTLESSTGTSRVDLDLTDIPGGVLILQLDDQEQRKLFRLIKLRN